MAFEDGNTSERIIENMDQTDVKNQLYQDKSDFLSLMLHSGNIFSEDEIDIITKDYRFGVRQPNTVKTLKEYLFFTKPDLNIIYRDPKTGVISNSDMQENLVSHPFWKDMKKRKLNIIQNCLQESCNPDDKFNHLLQNSVTSTLEVPRLEGTTIDSPVNNYGVGFQYRGTSEASDDSLDFSLEFKDTKNLDVYYFFKAYEEYETMKHHGVISPWQGYITNRIIHDQFSVYKFLVDEDMETIIYYCKFYGVMPMGLPRDVFSSVDFPNGLTFTIDFKAAFFEELRYDILRDFNSLSSQNYYKQPYKLDVYNPYTASPDYRPAKAAMVSVENGKYKLKWKGDDKI